ncbi:MAG: LysR family transcriptional regulator [Prevotellaceae bacterium]|jgi:LysR family hydrogen peroxide-inducible transcriptional activator|nr:LysR family transcriptional regulator [Prevotellaceae bacterium]
MNASVQQLEYIVAVDTWRHFQTAADSCFVTQPTLSMQIQKLEDEIGFKIFDRNRKPVVPTKEGEKIVAQARKILGEYQRLREQISEMKGSLEGELKLGIIPTIAPYLLPLFLKMFLDKFPTVRLHVDEIKTGNMLRMIRHGELDAAILSTPINETGFNEELLYIEEFLVYVSPKEELYQLQHLSVDNIAGNSIWLLEDGHCLRDQLINFCSIASNGSVSDRFNYQAGSIETLKRMVDLHGGLTFMPKLATQCLSDADRKNLRPFVTPVPAREVSIISSKDGAKQKILDVLKKEILGSISADVTQESYITLAHQQ